MSPLYLKLQSTFACSVRERFYLGTIFVATSVEDDGSYAYGLRTLGDRLPHRARLGTLGTWKLTSVSCRERGTCIVINKLC